MHGSDGQEQSPLEEPRSRGFDDWSLAVPTRLREWRERPRNRRLGIWVLVLVLAGHAVVVGLMWRSPQPQPPAAESPIAVTLIEPQAALPPPPPAPPMPTLPGQPAPAAPAPPPPPRHPPVARAKGSMAATLESSEGHPLDLYNAQGQARVPTGSGPPSSAPAYRTPELQGSQIGGSGSPITYKPTRFNKDWAPVNESLGAKTVGRAIEKAIDKTTVKKTIHLPGGIKLHCALSPLALFAGCRGDEPPPPPKNDDDVRLSMPPPETLTGKKVKLPSSASSVPPPASTR